jgi:hypothetical protein
VARKSATKLYIDGANDPEALEALVNVSLDKKSVKTPAADVETELEKVNQCLDWWCRCARVTTTVSQEGYRPELDQSRERDVVLVAVSMTP